MQDSGDTLGLGITRLVRDGKLHFANVSRPMDVLRMARYARIGSATIRMRRRFPVRLPHG